MSDLAKIAGLANVIDGLEGLVDESSQKTVAVGTPVDYGRYLEEGTSQMPPYPWLEPAVDGVTSRSGRMFESSENVDEFIMTVAREIEREAVQTLESTGERPYRQTGNLAGSVTVEEL